MTLSTAEYRTLIARSIRAVDAGTGEPGLRTLFTPDAHRAALDPDSTVVRGGRGVGKTVWFRALQDHELRQLTASAYRLGRLDAARSVPGYGERLSPTQYPGPAALNGLVASGFEPFDIWSTVLLTTLGVPALQDLRRWPERIAWRRDNPDDYDLALHAADRQAVEDQATTLVLFDALDRLHNDRSKADALIGGILRLSLDLRTRTRALRAKVFIRHDMFDNAERQFPDASKLTGNAADLTWSPTDLFGLLYHLMGNAEDSGDDLGGTADLAARFRGSTGRWTEEVGGRYTAPREVIGDRDRQRKLFEAIAGPYMGSNHRRGRPYTWLPNHLVDGIDQVSPRSFLSAVRTAAAVTGSAHAGHPTPLHWEGIRQGVQQASRTRVDEITEDLPWVRTAIEPLRGVQVPIDESEVLTRWTAAGLASALEPSGVGADDQVRTGPRSTGGSELVEELRDNGVMTRRVDGRLDLPDIYRIAFGIGRKGGVPKLSR